MNSRYVLAIGATIIVMALLFFKDNKQQAISTQADSQSFDEKTDTGKSINSVPVSEQSAAVLPSGDASSSYADNRSYEEIDAVNQEIAHRLSIHIKAMGQCLGLKQLQNVEDKIEPKSDSLIEKLKSSVGDVVVSMDDWTQSEIIDEDGSKKRIRVDYDYPDGTNPSRRLSIYVMNSYGSPEIVNLTVDQADNPNEAYIQSLTENKKIISDEKGFRAYFSNGEELVLTTKNGKLQSLSMSRFDKTFNCFNLDVESSNCVCP